MTSPHCLLERIVICAATALAVAGLQGCDELVSREVNGNSRIEVRDFSCSYSGYCYTCLPGFDGKLKCAPKLSPKCRGKESARVEVTPMVDTFESGRRKEWDAVKKLETLTQCH